MPGKRKRTVEKCQDIYFCCLLNLEKLQVLPGIYSEILEFNQPTFSLLSFQAMNNIWSSNFLPVFGRQHWSVLWCFPNEKQCHG